MVVGNENVGLVAPALVRRAPPASQRAQARAAIQNKLCAVGRNQLQAGRVATIAPGCRIDRWCRAAHAPKTQLSDRRGHFCGESPACITLESLDALSR